jgi:low affinity Fe/Cu permease
MLVDLRDGAPGRSDQPVHNGDAPESPMDAQRFRSSAKTGGGVGAPTETHARSPSMGASKHRRPNDRPRHDEPNASPDDASRHQKGPSRGHELFRHFAHLTSTGVGSPWAFTLACAVIVVWAATGPIFHFSDTWQLVINTGTTIITFLMVFLIQNTQNRDAVAIHLKLDELICALKGARNQLVDVEELSDEELERLRREFRRLSSGTTKSHPYVGDEDS